MKQTRLIKRRSLAKELCEDGAVSINGHVVRAGRDVSPGDALTLSLRNRRLAIEVVDIPERPPSTAHASSSNVAGPGSGFCSGAATDGR